MDQLQRRTRFEDLFNAHAAAVRAYAGRRVDATAADDVVSEVFVVAWRRLDDVPVDALPWLLGCARRVLSHHRRRLSRDLALAARIGSVPGAVETVAAPDGALAVALEALSERDRELLLLIAWEGLEPAQASRVLGCSRNALAVRLHRARRRFAAALAEADGAGLSPESSTRTKEAF